MSSVLLASLWAKFGACRKHKIPGPSQGWRDIEMLWPCQHCCLRWWYYANIEVCNFHTRSFNGPSSLARTRELKVKRNVCVLCECITIHEGFRWRHKKGHIKLCIEWWYDPFFKLLGCSISNCKLQCSKLNFDATSYFNYYTSLIAFVSSAVRLR